MARPKKTADQSATVSVSLRIDPRIKYGIDLAARIQKRTVTGVVEWAVERALADVQLPKSVIAEHDGSDAPTDLASNLDDRLWSSNEGVRLVLLAYRYPSLLSYEETRIWETIKLSPPLWRRLPRSAEGCSPWENAKLSVIADKWPAIIDIVESRKDVAAITHADLDLPLDPEMLAQLNSIIDDSIDQALGKGIYSRESLKVVEQKIESMMTKLREQKSRLYADVERMGKQEEPDQD
ncbi:hypothetical protein D9M68_345730 [compost metagenome]